MRLIIVLRDIIHTLSLITYGTSEALPPFYARGTLPCQSYSSRNGEKNYKTTRRVQHLDYDARLKGQASTPVVQCICNSHRSLR